MFSVVTSDVTPAYHAIGSRILASKGYSKTILRAIFFGTRKWSCVYPLVWNCELGGQKNANSTKNSQEFS